MQSLTAYFLSCKASKSKCVYAHDHEIYYSGTDPVALEECLCKEIEPLPKQKYGFDMANYGPYMAHIWVRYGMVRTSYGKYMVPKFVKFQAMGSTWDWKPKKRFVW